MTRSILVALALLALAPTTAAGKLGRTVLVGGDPGRRRGIGRRR